MPAGYASRPTTMSSDQGIPNLEAIIEATVKAVTGKLSGLEGSGMGNNSNVMMEDDGMEAMGVGGSVYHGRYMAGTGSGMIDANNPWSSARLGGYGDQLGGGYGSSAGMSTMSDLARNMPPTAGLTNVDQTYLYVGNVSAIWH